MQRPRWEHRDWLLIAALVVAATAYGLRDAYTEYRPSPWHTEMLAAARHAEAAQAAIRADKAARGIVLDRADDPNATGLIGPRWSGMTTTLGVLEAKRTTTNPNFAALAVALLKACGAKPGERVALNLSASFPALNVAVLAAADTLGLETVSIASLGASMWGANDPAYPWLDMEDRLLATGLLRRVAVAASLGGADDVGKDMDPDTRAALRARLVASGRPMIEEADLKRNVEARLALYLAGGRPACFVNVGGNLAATGATAHTSAAVPGLIRPTAKAESGEDQRLGGLIGAFLARGVPAIHLLDIKALALRHGLPYDPLPLPAAGEGSVYRQATVNRGVITTVLAVVAALLAGYVRLGRRHRGRGLRIAPNEARN